MLNIELVPEPIWGVNLRSLLPPAAWDAARRATYQRVGYKCEVCGGKGPTHPVECHEKWEYDEAAGVARLVGLLGLCPACHLVLHIGRAQAVGKMGEALTHLRKVNKCTMKEAKRQIDAAFAVWTHRSRLEWRVEIAPMNTGA